MVSTAKFQLGIATATLADLRAPQQFMPTGERVNDFISVAHHSQLVDEVIAMQEEMQKNLIKTKKITGTTGSTEGSLVKIAHGLTLSKIIGLNVLVTADNGNLIPPEFVAVNEFEYGVFIDPTDVLVILSATNSGLLLGNAISVLLMYEP